MNRVVEDQRRTRAKTFLVLAGGVLVLAVLYGLCVAKPPFSPPIGVVDTAPPYGLDRCDGWLMHGQNPAHTADERRDFVQLAQACYLSHQVRR